MLFITTGEALVFFPETNEGDGHKLLGEALAMPLFVTAGLLSRIPFR